MKKLNRELNLDSARKVAFLRNGIAMIRIKKVEIRLLNRTKPSKFHKDNKQFCKVKQMNTALTRNKAGAEIISLTLPPIVILKKLNHLCIV